MTAFLLHHTEFEIKQFNRGHDSIAVFEVQSDGTMNEAVFSSSGGSGPRDFHLAGNYVLSSNQYTGELAVLELNQKTRRLECGSHSKCRTAHLCPSPVMGE